MLTEWIYLHSIVKDIDSIDVGPRYSVIQDVQGVVPKLTSVRLLTALLIDTIRPWYADHAIDDSNDRYLELDHTESDQTRQLTPNQ